MRHSKTEGWYTFADGYHCWFRGLSAAERKVEEKHHGKLIRFERTAYQTREPKGFSPFFGFFFGRIPSENTLAFSA